MTMRPTGNHTGASGVVATADAPDERAVAIVWTREAAASTKDDARRRHATTGDATTSRRMRGKWEERRQRTKGNGALIG